MKMKNWFVLGIVFVCVLAFSSIASALSISEVKVDGDTLAAGDNWVEKNNQYEVKVVLDAAAGDNYKDVQVSAYLKGDEYDDQISDTSDAFDLDNTTTRYVKKLKLVLPVRMEQDSYKLYVRVENRDGTLNIGALSYNLKVKTAKHLVYASDVILSPSNGVKAGRALLATVRVQNRGLKDEDSVKVTFSIPELGISASDYIDELERDGDSKDSKSTEELYLRIPECAKAGTYDGVVEVSYKDGDLIEKKKVNVIVLADEACEAAPIISTGVQSTVAVGPESQDIVKGTGGVVYPVTITNAGSAKTYVISVTGGDWGTFRVSPTNVITVGQGETKTAYIYASANANAASGVQVFSVDIKEGDKSLKQVVLKANVTGGAGQLDLKRALEWTLIILVVILVILGLIIGFRKLKGDDEGKEEGQSYY
jgi:hypothetical protein